MMRSFSLRTRCATASSRGSTAVADLVAPLFVERVDCAPLERDEREPAERDVRDRLAVLPLLLALLARRVPLLLALLARPVPLERVPLERVPLERVPLERVDRL